MVWFQKFDLALWLFSQKIFVHDGGFTVMWSPVGQIHISNIQNQSFLDFYILQDIFGLPEWVSWT